MHKIDLAAPKKIQSFMFRFLEIFFEILRYLLQIILTLSIFELEKFSFIQVRILPEIDWYHF